MGECTVVTGGDFPQYFDRATIAWVQFVYDILDHTRGAIATGVPRQIVAMLAKFLGLLVALDEESQRWLVPPLGSGLAMFTASIARGLATVLRAVVTYQQVCFVTHHCRLLPLP
jgi:hypothetical protein